MVHGTQQRKTIRIVAAALANQGAALRCARYASHPSRKGSRAPSVALVMSVRPQSKPYAHQSRGRGESSNARVAHKIVIASSAENDASHMLSTGSRIALGKIAQSQAAATATDL